MATYPESKPLLFMLMTSFSLSGCALGIPPSYVSRDEVTLPQAMKDLACGLKTLQNEQARLNVRTGTFVDQVDITLDLKASATGTSTLVVDAKANPPASVLSALGITYTDETKLVGERSNQLKITLKNVTTAQLNKAGLKAATDAKPEFDLGPTVLYPLENPCDPKTVYVKQGGKTYAVQR